VTAPVDWVRAKRHAHLSLVSGPTVPRIFHARAPARSYSVPAVRLLPVAGLVRGGAVRSRLVAVNDPMAPMDQETPVDQPPRST